MRSIGTASLLVLVLVLAALAGCRPGGPAPATDDTVAGAARVELRIDGMT